MKQLWSSLVCLAVLAFAETWQLFRFGVVGV